MQAQLIALAWGMVKKLVTEKFFTEVFLQIGQHVVKMTSNTLDDEFMGSVEKALGRESK